MALGFVLVLIGMIDVVRGLAGRPWRTRALWVTVVAGLLTAGAGLLLLGGLVSTPVGITLAAVGVLLSVGAEVVVSGARQRAQRSTRGR